MKRTIYLLASVGLVLALFGLGLRRVSSISKQEQLKEIEDATDKGSVAWHVRKAKVTGDKQITIPSEFGLPEQFTGLDDAMSRFKAILGEPIEKYTAAKDESLVTWYKFKVLEDLSSNGVKGCSSCGDSVNIPDELLPLESDEILVPQPGGVLTI